MAERWKPGLLLGPVPGDGPGMWGLLGQGQEDTAEAVPGGISSWRGQLCPGRGVNPGFGSSWMHTQRDRAAELRFGLLIPAPQGCSSPWH